MPRGENPEFKDRVGELSMRLKRLNVERRINARYPDVTLDKVDVEAYLAEDECFSTIWESVEDYLERVYGSKDLENMSESEIDALIERYEAMRQDYEDREKGGCVG